MSQVHVEELIEVEREALYALAQDYRRRFSWDSHVKRIRYERGSVISRVGFAGTAHMLNPFEMTVEHFQLCAPVLLASNMLKGPCIFSKVGCAWRFEQLNHRLTKVVLSYQFGLRWPVLDILLTPIVMKIIQRDARRFLADLKYAAEETDLLMGTSLNL